MPILHNFVSTAPPSADPNKVGSDEWNDTHNVSIVNADIASNAAIEATKIGSGTVSNAEYSYLDGVTSSIQTQLDGKQGTGSYVNANVSIIGATKTKITYDSKGLVTAGADIGASDLPTGIDASKIADGSVSNAKFQYLGNVTSDIQTQINGKQAAGSYLTSANIDDTAYDATTWNGDTTHAPSKNAVRNKIESMGGGGDISGTGVVGQVAEFVTNTKTLQAAKLIAPASNILTLTNSAASTLALAISTAKTLTLTAADNYNLTVPATGTAALLAIANVFTTQQNITGSSNQVQLIVKANATQTTDIIQFQNSAGIVVAGVDSRKTLFSYGGAGGATNNVFFNGAGNDTVSGGSNFGFGSETLRSITSASNNTAMGVAALRQATSNGANIGIGTSAGRNTTGVENIFIGDSAGQNFTSGDRNTIIGASAGKGVSGSTSGNYNLFIGGYAGRKQTSVSNTLLIDTQDRASSAIELTNSIIYGIMASTPSAQTLTFNAVTKVAVDTTTTNAPVTVFDLKAYVSTASTGFANGGGVGLTFTGETATDGTSQLMAKIYATYIDSTNASRKSKLTLSAYDTAERIGFEIEASGTVAKLGFFAVTPVVKPTALTTQLTTITFTAPVTPDYALQDVTNLTPYGFADAEEARTFISVVKNLQTRVSELETKLQSLGLLT